MKFFGDTKIDFIGKRKLAFLLSIIIIVVGVASLLINKGPKLSIDFTGGMSIELDISPVDENAKKINIQEIRDILEQENIDDTEIQDVKGTDIKSFILIKTKSTEVNGVKLSDKIINIIKTNYPNNVNPDTFIRLQEEVGPRIGEELGEKALLAIFWALLGIILYIWWRFQFTFGLAAVAALFHDVLITIGIFSILGKEVSLPVVAALLTIIGYSLNDTIVVFDRIREDLKVYRRESYGSVINHSINETLSRTIITSLTTFVVVLSLYIFGGSVIHDFAFALLIGVIVGTYSSIFIASPILAEHFTRKQQKMGGKRK
ncbi:MAG: protein translocase subunit SecF [Candidatus Cloacimonetes bacterium]|nr:protein translocase subunit SecF [Candidatus Cloacimonadota bacterium]